MVGPLDKGGGGGGGRSPKNFFSALRASVWSKNKGGARPPLSDPPVANHDLAGGWVGYFLSTINFVSFTPHKKDLTTAKRD